MIEKKPKKENNIPENAKKELERRKVVIGYSNRGGGKKVKYSKTTFALIYQGYDMLENLMVVRQYIQRRYDIDMALLEILLFLSPKQYFTQGDFAQMAKRFNYSRIGNLVGTGHVRLMTIGSGARMNLYCLSATGKGIVSEFYECLVGETKIPEYKELNPMAKPKATAFDKKRMEMIKRINQIAVPDHKKPLFE
jgi:hypothetical protein